MTTARAVPLKVGARSVQGRHEHGTRIKGVGLKKSTRGQGTKTVQGRIEIGARVRGRHEHGTSMTRGRHKDCTGTASEAQLQENARTVRGRCTDGLRTVRGRYEDGARSARERREKGTRTTRGTKTADTRIAQDEQHDEHGTNAAEHDKDPEGRQLVRRLYKNAVRAARGKDDVYTAPAEDGTSMMR